MTLAEPQQQVAAQLIERLLTDPAFRARFRRDPAQACRAAGLDDVADELSLGGSAMMTLEVRESRSSLAGVMMAAAMEGVGVYQFTKSVVPHLEDAASSIGGVLSHVNLPAIKDLVDIGGGGAPASAVGASGLPVGVEEPEADAPAAAAAAPPPAGVAPEVAAASEAPAAPKQEPEKPEKASEAEQAAQELSAPPDLPGATDLPDAGSVSDAALPEGGAEPDASQYGVAGGGGDVSAEAKAVLEHDKITLDDTGKADMEAGKVDPRAAAVLLKLAEDHEITVTAISSDHPSASAGGGSNHYYGRGVDIGTIDGEIVTPGSPAARELASALGDLPEEIRPTEIGSPFSISAPGYFTDSNHQDHIHFAFDEEVSSDWQSPEEIAAGVEPTSDAGHSHEHEEDAAVTPVAGAVAPAAGTVAPEAGAVAPAEPSPADKTGSFLAIKGEPEDKKRATGQFLAVEKPEPPPAPVEEPQAATSEPVGAVGEYPGDDAPKEQIALWMASRAEEAGLPPELPVMASLVESGVQNLNYGDSSSVGYFQMLTTIWDQGKYKGYLDDPEKQMQWFIDTASPLKAQFGDGPATAENYGTWVADTERPAEQYRYKYAERFEEAKALIEKGKESAGSAPPPDSAPTTAAPETTTAAPSHEHEHGAPPDASQYGVAGGGGELSAEAKAVLSSDKITLDETGKADMKAGRVDPRACAALLKLAEDHTISVTAISSDHPSASAGGGSNHYYGRGIDIGTIDGEIVRPESPAARVLAEAVGELPESIRPSEIGSPFSIGAPGYFTDGNHQDHIHLGFDDEVSADWKSPEELAAAPAEVAQAVAAPAVAPEQGTGAFMAIPAEPKDADAAKTGAFMAAVSPEPAQPQVPADAVRELGQELVPEDAEATTQAAGGSSSLGSAALETAKSQLGVKEVGTNAGPKVDEYLAAAGIGPGNPWCASFVTWSLEQNGHKMDGSGWAAVQTWVRAAEAGTNDLEVVSAEDARPGDIVAYDWGGQEDFGSDGHIGFLASEVDGGGSFTALEGNNADAVMNVDRNLDVGNVKFLRIAGEGGGAPPAPTEPPPAPEEVALQSATPEEQAAATLEEPEPEAKDETGEFMAVVKEDKAPRKTAMFLKAIDPEQAKAATVSPEEVAAGTAPQPDAPADDVPLDLGPDSDYPGDDAPKEEIAKWMARKAEAAGLPPELPVMASLVESNLQNLNYGDASSVGYFQMLTEFWDTGKYKGYLDDPDKQIQWFIDHASAVKDQRVDRGLPIDDPSEYGVWIADTERPAEQYRGRYQLRLEEARRLLRS